MINPEYQRDIDYTYLVIPFISTMESEHSLQMLLSNRITGLLPLSKKAVNGEEKLYYNITSRQSVDKVFENEEYGYHDVKKLMVNIYLVLQKMKEYLMNENGIVLNPEFVFYQPEEQSYEFVFLPETTNSFREQFHFLTEYLLGRIDYEDDRVVEFVQYLYRESKNENFSLKLALDYLSKESPSIEEAVSAVNDVAGISEELKDISEACNSDTKENHKWLNALIPISLIGSILVFLYVMFCAATVNVYEYILFTFLLSVLGICLWEKRMYAGSMGILGDD